MEGTSYTVFRCIFIKVGSACFNYLASAGENSGNPLVIDTLHETMGARKIPQIETRYPGKHILAKIDGLGAEKLSLPHLRMRGNGIKR